MTHVPPAVGKFADNGISGNSPTGFCKGRGPGPRDRAGREAPAPGPAPGLVDSGPGHARAAATTARHNAARAFTFALALPAGGCRRAPHEFFEVSSNSIVIGLFSRCYCVRGVGGPMYAIVYPAKERPETPFGTREFIFLKSVLSFCGGYQPEVAAAGIHDSLTSRSRVVQKLSAL